MERRILFLALALALVWLVWDELAPGGGRRVSKAVGLA